MAVLQTSNFTLEWRFLFTSLAPCGTAESYFWILAKSGNEYLIAPSLLAGPSSWHEGAPEGALLCEDADFSSIAALRAALERDGNHRHFDNVSDTPEIIFEACGGTYYKIIIQIGEHDFAAQAGTHVESQFAMHLTFTSSRPALEAFLFDLLDEIHAASYPISDVSRQILESCVGDLDRAARKLPYLGKSSAA